MNNYNGNTPNCARSDLKYKSVLSASLLLALPFVTFGQASDEEENVYTLSPFEVDGTADQGYRATSTLAGTRIKTDLRDVGSAISVMTEEFIKDVGGTDNETLLTYALNTEVGGPRGNFSGGVSGGSTPREVGLFGNPNGNTRVRGLSEADNTRNFFITDVPWDSYAVSRVDLQRGPNAILFGLGSPAGVVNATLQKATFSNEGEVQLRFDKFGSIRTSANLNKMVLEDELAVRFAVLKDDQKYRQEPAFDDDKRLYLAARYTPKFLNGEGTRVEFSANYESGDIESNRPRTLTPGDYVTPFWDPVAEAGLGQMTFNVFEDQDLLDQFRDTSLGTTARLFETRPRINIGSNEPWAWSEDIIDAHGALTADGNYVGFPIPDDPGSFYSGAVYGSNRYGTHVSRSFSDWAIATGQPYASEGFYENRTLSDASVYDFYNNLLDGPNKGEWTNWDTYELSFTNTYFNDKLGVDVSYFNQELDRGQWGVLGWNSQLFIDINEVNVDGSPNLDLGRVFVQEQMSSSGSGTQSIGREAVRAQVFGEYDFMEHSDNFLSRLLGKHRLTGLYSTDKSLNDRRQVLLTGFGPDYLEAHGEEDIDGMRPSFRYYLTGDVRGAAGPEGLAIPGMTENFFPEGGTYSTWAFDTTWIAGDSISPSDPWTDPEGNTERDGTPITQAENPANYKGWGYEDFELISFFDDGMVNGMSTRDYLTIDAILSDMDIESEVAVWQGYFLDGSIVGTYGYRKDSAVSTVLKADERGDEGADVSPLVYNFGNPSTSIQSLETETTNWSVAMHVNRLLGMEDKLPLNVSLYYNSGENFEPAADRLDFWGRPLPPPQGTTEEVSVLLESRDGKYSLRATSYETEVLNQNTSGSIDGNKWRLEQTIYASARAYAMFETGLWNPNDYGDAERLTDVIMPSWYEFATGLEERFPEFVENWTTEDSLTSGSTTISAQAPAGYTLTEDAVSKGLEFEFIANPIQNWRISMNVSKTEAVRDQVPGPTFLAVAEYVEDKIMNTPAGEIPIWWVSNPNGARGTYIPYRGDYLKLLALNGQSQGEIRKWRGNLVTSYDFTDGAFNGLRLGGAYRYADSSVVDYAPLEREDGSVTVDLDRPYIASEEENVDLWVGYSKDLSEKLTWSVQLNAYNVFGKNEIIPLNTQPDGTPSTYRIKEGSSWSISNTFSF